MPSVQFKKPGFKWLASYFARHWPTTILIVWLSQHCTTWWLWSSVGPRVNSCRTIGSSKFFLIFAQVRTSTLSYTSHIIRRFIQWSFSHQKSFFLNYFTVSGLFAFFFCTELPTWKKSATHVWKWRHTIPTECTTSPCATLRRLAALPQSWHRWSSTADHSQTWVHFATCWGWMDWPWLCGASISLVMQILLQWHYTFFWFLQNVPQASCPFIG